MLSRLGAIEFGWFLLLVATVIWVYFDAPKHGIKPLVAIIGIIFLLFPVSLFLYILITRVLRPRALNK